MSGKRRKKRPQGIYLPIRKERLITISAKVPYSIYRRLKGKAEYEGVSLSEMVRRKLK